MPSNQRLALAEIEPAIFPQAADATQLSWDWGGWVGDVQ
jgi:hypothetical protein